ncbi:LppX_LprAFG lipoprotein [Streptomyces sp. RGM 3693]|uniref:LppX_LprAFG lipoprotein n=1 Tax=Streptomyces sp. RGM 3693 TaxID=3413284 RepID=UPI003D26B11D
MRRRIVLAATTAALCAACSPTDSPQSANTPTPTDVVQSAVTATTHTSARINATLELTADGTTSYHIQTQGSLDMAADRGRLDVRLIEGSNRAEELLVGDKIYVRNVEPEGVDHTWAVATRHAAEAHYLLRAPLNDPEHTLVQIARMRNARNMGKDTVNGTQATRYSGNLDHKTLTLRMAKKTRQKLDDLRDSYGRDLPVAAEAWVDAQGRLVQARLALKDKQQALATLTLALSDLGKPVRVTQPTHASTLDTTTGNLMSG